MLGDRIKEARKYAGYSQENLSEKINLSKRTLINYEKNDKEPVLSSLVNIAKYCNINEWWLLTGKGDMLDINSNENKLTKNEPTSNLININFYPEVYAAAGYGALNGDASPKTIQLSKSFLDEILDVRNYSNLDIIRVYGDSMEPYISNGEYVIIEKNHEAYNGETVIANINGEVYIKKFQKDPFNTWVKLISDNKNYDDIHITGDNLNLLQIVGIVRAKIKPF